MKPIEGRLQSAEHILCKVLELKLKNIKLGIAMFKEDSGRLEVHTEQDLRELDKKELEDEVNEIISRNLAVKKYNITREEANKQFNMTRVPDSVKEVTIVEFEGYDSRPCRDPHVSNTNQIGKFKLLRIKKGGSGRYKFGFRVE
jgi:misacylated tRNA(Ala) deacylase